MALFISFLGIFGISAYMAEQRSKEIGIRKVMGALLRNIIQLMNKDFIIIGGFSCLVAFPIAYYFLQNWLSKYGLKIDI